MSSTAEGAARRPRLTPAMADARRAVRECLQRHTSPVSDGATFLIAVSGGADSLALAWAAAFELPRHGYRPMAVIVDHQLQEGSDEVAQTAKATVEEFGLEAEVVRVSVTGDGGLENAAREARYEALEGFVKTHGAEGVMLAHTLDDQAETVLMGLTRGSGPHSLSGMPVVSGTWWRPFLGLRRRLTEKVLHDLGVSWWDDPQNSDLRFMRPRIRHELLPALQEILGQGVVEALARTARLVRVDCDELDAQADEYLRRHLSPEGLLGFKLRSLMSMPNAIRTRVLRAAWEETTGKSISELHTWEMTDWLERPGRRGAPSLPGGSVALVDDRVIFEEDRPGEDSET